MASVRTAFKPEFLNRLDEVVIFDPLSQGRARHIVDLQVRSWRPGSPIGGSPSRLTDEARAWLGAGGLRPGVWGAPAQAAGAAGDRRPTRPGRPGSPATCATAPTVTVDRGHRGLAGGGRYLCRRPGAHGHDGWRRGEPGRPPKGHPDRLRLPAGLYRRLAAHWPTRRPPGPAASCSWPVWPSS
jgi:hypothetical protein